MIHRDYGHMKNIIIAFLLALSVALPLAAADGERDMELVTFDTTDFANSDEVQAFWFLTSYQMVLQNQGYGAIAVFDEDLNFLSAVLSDNTPSWFLTDPPASTLTIPYAVPTAVAVAMLAPMDVPTAISPILEYDPKMEKAVAMVTSVKTYDEVVLGDPAYVILREALERSVGANGLEVEDFYAVWERNGRSEEDLVDMIIANEATPSQLALEAIRLMKAEAEAPDTLSRSVPMLFAVLGVLAVVIAVISVLAVLSSRKKTEGMNLVEEEEENRKGEDQE